MINFFFFKSGGNKEEDNQNKHHVQHAGDVDDVAIIGRGSLAAIHTVASVMLV
ncbi:MAG: hypothetical protein VX848_01295 [Verrucomicrobiota bacterium]|nr:hypothetical protein [Verrucomicrobiota bacterium]MEC7856435.1 hypothetical protein [Verrucomicrobiota bacterium]MEC8659398.1 hypothetical protein [Verrucomicrobiota bacterium]